MTTELPVSVAGWFRAAMRVNLAVLHGPESADTVIDGDPAWDIEAALGFLDWSSAVAVADRDGPWTHVSADLSRSHFEAFVARALARLG